jgi:CheY-like chemotaxis protein
MSGCVEQRFTVLIFDDSPFDGEAIMMLCEGCGYIVEVASSEDEAMRALAQQKFDLILVDYHQPAPFNCVEFVSRISHCSTAVAIISGDSIIEQVCSSLRGTLPHLAGFFMKPLTYSNVQQFPNAIHQIRAAGS